MSLKYFEFLLLLPFIALGLVQVALENRLEFVSKIEGDTETLFEFNFRLLGRQHLLNGTIVFHVDLSNEFEVSNELFLYQDGEWIPSSISVCLKSCPYFKTIFDRYFASSFKDSNYPIGNCPIKKGEYYLKNVEMSADSWSLYIRTGLNKFIFKIKKNNITYGGLELILVLTERSI